MRLYFTRQKITKRRRTFSRLTRPFTRTINLTPISGNVSILNLNAYNILGEYDLGRIMTLFVAHPHNRKEIINQMNRFTALRAAAYGYITMKEALASEHEEFYDSIAIHYALAELGYYNKDLLIAATKAVRACNIQKNTIGITVHDLIVVMFDILAEPTQLDPIHKTYIVKTCYGKDTLDKIFKFGNIQADDVITKTDIIADYVLRAGRFGVARIYDLIVVLSVFIKEMHECYVAKEEPYDALKRMYDGIANINLRQTLSFYAWQRTKRVPGGVLYTKEVPDKTYFLYKNFYLRDAKVSVSDVRTLIELYAISLAHIFPHIRNVILQPYEYWLLNILRGILETVDFHPIIASAVLELWRKLAKRVAVKYDDFVKSPVFRVPGTRIVFSLKLTSIGDIVAPPIKVFSVVAATPEESKKIKYFDVIKKHKSWPSLKKK